MVKELKAVDPESMAYLAQYGVPGMKWGIRKSFDGKIGVAKSQKDPSKPTTDIPARHLNDLPMSKGAYRSAKGPVKRALNDLNNSPKYKGKHVLEEPLKSEYRRDAGKAVGEGMLKGVKRANLKSTAVRIASVIAVVSAAKIAISIATVGLVVHAKQPEIFFKPIWDENGFLVDFEEFAEDELNHADSERNRMTNNVASFLASQGVNVEEDLLQYGVKGMKWDKNLTPEEKAEKERLKKLGESLNSDMKALAGALDKTNKASRDKALRRAGSPLFDTPVGYMAKTKAYFEKGGFFGLGKGKIRTEGADLKWTVKQGKVNKFIESQFKKVTGNK